MSGHGCGVPCEDPPGHIPDYVIWVGVKGEPVAPGRDPGVDPSTRLDFADAHVFVSNPGAGGIATFCGTTRNTHAGRPVARLVYDGHPRLMKSITREICMEAFKAAGGYSRSTAACAEGGAATSGGGGGLTRAAVEYRLGEVPVGETSVIVAVSAPHRREAFQACEYIVDELKARVPMWKQEWYADDEQGGVWKENCECSWRARSGHEHVHSGGGSGAAAGSGSAPQ